MFLNFHLLFWTFILTNIFLSYLVYSGCYNKYQRFINRNLFLTALEGESQGASMFQWRPFSYWQSSCIAEGVRDLWGVSFIRLWIPFIRALLSWVKPKTPPPNTFCWALGFQLMNFGENTNVDHITRIHSCCWVKLHFIHSHSYVTSHSIFWVYRLFILWQPNIYAIASDWVFIFVYIQTIYIYTHTHTHTNIYLYTKYMYVYTYIYVCIQILSHYRLLQEFDYSSLCYTVSPYCFIYFLYNNVYMLILNS